MSDGLIFAVKGFLFRLRDWLDIVPSRFRNIVRREVQVAQGGKTPQSSLSNVGHLDVGKY